MSRIRTLIVDDEPLARERLRELLAREPDIELAGECANGRDAVAAMLEHAPDLVFLDIQMPEMSGFEALEALGEAPLPAVVFVTAYDEFALRAFEVHALDYLLKPFDRERFRRSLDRARAAVRDRQGNDLDRRLAALLAEVGGGARRYPTRLVVKTDGRAVLLRVADIDWIESAGNYVRLHVGRERHQLRETLAALETQLDPQQFARIHRSTIVNIDRIRELQPYFHGDYVVKLHDGRQLTLSRTYRERLEERLGKAL